MTIAELIAVIAGILGIISFCINLIQWKSKKDLVVTLRSRSQATYNYFYTIAKHLDRIRNIPSNTEDDQSKLQKVINEVHFITGVVDTARLDITSYCREHLGFLPVAEHPAQPYKGQLPTPEDKDAALPSENANQ
jgi:hypothetical protein